jgi:GNAT superfamily N-acetyltransferase
MTTTTSQPVYHTLYADAPEPLLQAVLDLNNQIFGVDPTRPVSHHGSLSEWRDRLDEPLSIITYATISLVNKELPPGAEVGDGPAGFIFAHPKIHPGESAPTLHIWLAGVLPASRGTGMFQGLMRTIEDHAAKNAVKILSVATFPAKFGKMYSILLKTGWTREQDLGNGKVLLFKELK